MPAFVARGCLVGCYIIDVWKDRELVHSVAGKWKDDGEAGAMAAYYLGFLRAHSVQLLRDRTPEGGPTQTELIWEMAEPVGAVAGESILW